MMSTGLHAVVSRRLVTPEGVRPGAVLIEGEQIRAVVTPDDVPRTASTRDVGEMPVLPGLIDSHVHLNEPGRTDWEGFLCGTRAAAAGGYTMLVDMPLNCLPATTTVKALAAKREAARDQCLVDWAAWGGVVGDNQQELEPLAAAGVLGFKCFLIHPGIDGFSMVSEQELRSALPHIARTGLPLLVHAELPGPVETATARLAGADWTVYRTYLSSRPKEAELCAIQLLLSLCREYRFRLHIVHVSAWEGLDLLESARAEGLPVTAETCPHYLHFAAETVRDGSTLTKCAPPIRGQQNREKLWQGLAQGSLDLIVTDHSPCPPSMKRLDEGDFRRAWGGISSLAVALPVVWTGACGRGFGLGDVVRWMAENPARLAGCHARKGRIAAGYDADLVVFDPDTQCVVDKGRLHQRHSLSPYLGEKLRGVVKATYLRGRPVFVDGEFPGRPRGSELHRTRGMASGRPPLPTAIS